MKNSRKIYSFLQNRLTRKKKNRYFSFQKFHLSYKFDFLANLKIENLISFIKIPK